MIVIFVAFSGGGRKGCLVSLSKCGGHIIYRHGREVKIHVFVCGSKFSCSGSLLLERLYGRLRRRVLLL